MPAERVGDEPADGRPDEDGEAEDGSEEALVLASLGRREDVTDDGDGDGEEGPCAQPLDAAGGDEPLDRRRDAGQDGADEEDADPDQEDGSPAVQVGELAVDRAADGGRQEVGGEGPRVDGRCPAGR